MRFSCGALVFALASACGADGTEPPEPASPTPLGYESVNFTFHYGSLDSATIRSTAAVLEAARAGIISDLGGTEPPRVHVWLYSNHGDLERALEPLMGPIPPWASGATPRRDQIHMMSPNSPTHGPYATMVGNLVHELAHCVSLTINGTIGNNPRWLWESVAVYEAGQFRDPRTISYMTSLSPPTLAALNSFDNTRVYEVGYTIAEFIVTRWGRPSLRSLIMSNGDVEGTLGVLPSQFERDWFEYVRSKYGL